LDFGNISRELIYVYYKGDCMTRLTDEVIEREWNECVTLRGDGVWYRRFASRIAALAVAEYRSREVANLLAQLAERENLLTAVMESRAETEAQLAVARAKWADTDSRNTALRAQLAEAKEYGRVREHRRHELADEVMELRVVLAQVTKERDELAETSNHNARLHYEQAERACHAEAQLATAKRDAFKSGMVYGINAGPDVTIGDMLDKVDAQYPATPSGELCDADCGCPSPEAREVPSEVDIEAWGKDRDGRDVLVNVRITPADAKRIVAMGTA
jgi:hypothetical protein